MKAFRSRHIRRVLVPVMAVSLLSACHHWKVQEMAPAQVVTEKEPDKIRLTMLDGDRMELADPMISNGEIVGHPFRNVGAHKGVVRSDTLRVPIDSVAYVSTRALSKAPFAVLLITGTLVFLGYLGAKAVTDIGIGG